MKTTFEKTFAKKLYKGVVDGQKTQLDIEKHEC